ncbi:tripartite tricarboxylate transporter substrate binding protein [Advenella sp. S44]|uniref:Bug family tripartite tricarboxylate transporter substrate binding protein n=1 Tax=Advenella sp. S44 TaxID=1982755 RepID=UPI001374783F|nr:tripartite tricarboxylate transporter substrate binding protein [Advenella sp. S44]
MNFIRFATAMGVFMLPQTGFSASDYPVKPIRVIVPYAPGGSDLYIRPLQERLQERLGQPIVVENVGGAGGVVGSARVASSKPDGYTVLFAGSGAIVTAPKVTGATYTWRSFAPVANVISIPFTLVARANSRMKTFDDFLSQAKSEPGKINYASPGHGTSTQMAADAMAAAAGISIEEVPYQGGGPALTALLSDIVETAVATPSIVMPQVKAGKLVALAVTGEQRFPTSSDVPTMREKGVDVAVVSRYGFFMPRETPREIVRQFSEAVEYAVSDKHYVDLMRDSYNEIEFLGPAKYAEAVQEEDTYFTKLMQDMGMKIK